MKSKITLKMRVWFWWYDLKKDIKFKYERIRYLIKRRFQSHKTPEDEFDPSLNMNIRDMLAMTERERDQYIADLVRRRRLAHEADNARTGNP
jgi:hypothetical protein